MFKLKLISRMSVSPWSFLNPSTQMMEMSGLWGTRAVPGSQAFWVSSAASYYAFYCHSKRNQGKAAWGTVGSNKGESYPEKPKKKKKVQVWEN